VNSRREEKPHFFGQTLERNNKIISRCATKSQKVTHSNIQSGINYNIISCHHVDEKKRKKNVKKHLLDLMSLNRFWKHWKMNYVIKSRKVMPEKRKFMGPSINLIGNDRDMKCTTSITKLDHEIRNLDFFYKFRK